MAAGSSPSRGARRSLVASAAVGRLEAAYCRVRELEAQVEHLRRLLGPPRDEVDRRLDEVRPHVSALCAGDTPSRSDTLRRNVALHSDVEVGPCSTLAQLRSAQRSGGRLEVRCLPHSTSPLHQLPGLFVKLPCKKLWFNSDKFPCRISSCTSRSQASSHRSHCTNSVTPCTPKLGPPHRMD